MLRWTAAPHRAAPDGHPAASQAADAAGEELAQQGPAGAARLSRWSRTLLVETAAAARRIAPSTKTSASARATSIAPSAWPASQWTARRWSWPAPLSAPVRVEAAGHVSSRRSHRPGRRGHSRRKRRRAGDRPELAAGHRSRSGRLHRLSPREARRRAGSASRPRSRWSGPAFTMRNVQPGHTYDYAVSAIDQDGHESARSAEAEETVPEP